uniref:hypothetical protein n=1 Tax=Pseudomonas viridiflava TaxID=33069 RepID=UPI0013CEE515
VCSEAARKVAYDRKLIVDQLESLSRQADKLERGAFKADMQAEGFRIRMEQLIEENAKLKVFSYSIELSFPAPFQELTFVSALSL